LILGAPWPFARLQLHDTRVTVPLAQLQSRLSFKVASQQPLIQMNLDPSITLGSNTCLSNLTGACPMPRAPCPTPRASCPAPRALRPSLTALCRQRSRRPWPSPRSTPARRAPASSTTRTVGPRPQARGACCAVGRLGLGIQGLMVGLRLQAQGRAPLAAMCRRVWTQARSRDGGRSGWAINDASNWGGSRLAWGGVGVQADPHLLMLKRVAHTVRRPLPRSSQPPEGPLEAV
jgi:hypothetical protein